MLHIFGAVVLGITAIALSSLTPAEAALFRGTFEGSVTSGFENATAQELRGLGVQEVQGTFKYDTRTAPPDTSRGEDSGFFEFWGSPTWLTMEVAVGGNTYSFENPPAQHSITILSDRDFYQVVAENGLLEYRDNKLFRDTSGTTISLLDEFTDPIAKPTLDQPWAWSAGDGPINSGRNARGEVRLNSSIFNYETDDFDEQIRANITFDIQRLSVRPVPLPAALPLFATALVALGALAVRRRHG